MTFGLLPFGFAKMILLGPEETVQLHAVSSPFECTNMANVINQSRDIDES